MKRIVVVGGGISGLAAAHRVVERAPATEVLLLEAGDRAGGVIDTERRDGFLIERSADSFITQTPDAVELCRRLGIADQLIETDATNRRAMVVCRGRLERLPEGFLLLAPTRLRSILTSPVLSAAGKLRLLAEYFVVRRTATDDESLASFARRRFGRETFERIIQPLVGGIYTADPEKLSMDATMERFVAMEREQGGLIRGARRKSDSGAGNDEATGARYALFVAPRNGMSTLIDALVARLPGGALSLGTRATNLTPNPGGGWRVSASRDGGVQASIDCDGVIVALPTFHAAPLVAGFDAELSKELAAIEYAGAAIVSLGYRRDQIAHPLDAFGFVVPAIEKESILSASFSSVKFPGRAPLGHALIRVFLGGALQPELLSRSDDELIRLAIDALGKLIGARGTPVMTLVSRWPRSMPQYHLGHVDRVARIEKRASLHAGLALAGNAYHGVGMPHAIKSGEAAADHVLAFTATR